MINDEEWIITITEDRPITGMWHTGPNPCWVTVTHRPTMISARAYGDQQHKVRAMAMKAAECMVELAENMLRTKCSYPGALVASVEKTLFDWRDGLKTEDGYNG